MHILQKLKQSAREVRGTIVLPEAGDMRTLFAARAICDEDIAKVILLGDEEAINSHAKELKLELSGIEIIDPKKSENLEHYANLYYERRKSKGMTEEEALKTMQNELYFGAMMVNEKAANGMVAGAANTTADVLRSALRVVGVRKGLKTVSSAFIMVSPKAGEETFIFSDCAVVPNPSAEELADIASSAAITRRSILGDEPLVALLSFSTMGSAEHELVQKVQNAKAELDRRAVDFAYDGELQLDAAIIESVAKSKAPKSEVAGKANTLIFPDLQAANIGYKLVQRLAGYEAIGPIIQGLAAPICDLSRGCSIEDIINTSVLVLLLSKN